MPTLPHVDLKRLVAVLGPGSVWKPIEVLPPRGQSNTPLSSLADAPSGLVRIADQLETARLGNVFAGQSGSALGVSCVVRPRRQLAEWSWLPKVTALALTEGLRGVCRATGTDPTRVGLRWPHDVVVDDLVVGGVLVETDGVVVVLRWGLNVVGPCDDAAPRRFTSLATAGLSTDKTALVAAVQQSVAAYYTLWESLGHVRAGYREASATIGRSVRVTTANSVIEGHAVDIDSSGALLVDVPGFGVRILASGDVQHLP